MKRITGISLSEEVLEMTDLKRQFIARSVWIERILREKYGMEQLLPGHRAKGTKKTFPKKGNDD